MSSARKEGIRQGSLMCVFLLFCLLPRSVFSQPATAARFDPEAFKREQAAFTGRQGSRLALADKWKCTDGSFIFLDSIKGPVVLFVGFSTCAPCRALMIALNSILADRSYSDISFVYLTYDRSDQISEEFGLLRNLSGMHRISVSRDYIHQHRLAMGYPTVFFLNGNKIIERIETGGPTGGEEAISWWKQRLLTLASSAE